MIFDNLLRRAKEAALHCCYAYNLLRMLMSNLLDSIADKAGMTKNSRASQYSDDRADGRWTNFLQQKAMGLLDEPYHMMLGEKPRTLRLTRIDAQYKQAFYII